MNDILSQRMAVLRARVRTIPYQWVVVGLAVWASMGVAWPFQGLPVLYPFIQEDLKLSATQLGLITAAMLGGGIPTHVLGGLWLDVSGVRRVMTLVLMAQGLVVAAFFLGVSLPVILIVAVLAGVLEAPGYLGGARSLLDWVPRQRRGLATGLWSTGGAMGGIIAASVLPSFAQATSWQVAVLAVGGVIFLLGLVYGYLYRDAPQTGLVHPRVGLAALPILLRHLGLAGATIWASVFRALTYVLLTYLLLFLKDNLELSVVVAGRYLATAFFISLFARVGWGLVSDVLFKARRLVVCGIVGVVASIGFAGLSLSGNGNLPQASILVFVVLLGASILSWAALYTALVGEMVDPSQSGTALGASGTISSVAPMALPPLFGLLLDRTDSYTLMWGVAAAMAFISTMIMVVLARRA